MSSFKGIDLFGSGPHRTEVARRGMVVVPYSVEFNAPTVPGARAHGDFELIVMIRGRLVAATEAGLWALREAAAAETAFSRGDGELVDTRGRAHADMWFIRYEEFGAVDAGRAWSIGYEAAFRRLTV